MKKEMKDVRRKMEREVEKEMKKGVEKEMEKSVKESKEKLDEDIKNWLKKIEQVKQGDVDLSRDEDLSIAVMNLISLEEHFYFTAMKTNDGKYLNMLRSIRETRKELLGKIVTDPQGEEWCISKHLLAASMRLMEVGTKELAKEKEKEATSLFTSAFNLYTLFFAINLKLVKTEELKQERLIEEEGTSGNKSKMFDKFSEIVKKIVNCCKE